LGFLKLPGTGDGSRSFEGPVKLTVGDQKQL
jgi:hypothetical protein